jgi:hypothetical protein
MEQMRLAGPGPAIQQERTEPARLLSHFPRRLRRESIGRPNDEIRK